MPSTTATKPRKPLRRRKDAVLQVRVKESQRELYQRVADLHDLDLSDWVRQTLDAACEQYKGDDSGGPKNAGTRR